MSDMLVKLYDLPEVEPVVRKLGDQGILIRPAMPSEKHLVVQWVRRTFGAGWASECDVAFSNRPVSCLVATGGGEIVGFCCYESTCKNFFGPMGVAESHRGQGIGKALTLSCLQAMAHMGYAYAIIGGVGPADFYTKVAGAVEIEGSSPGIYRDRLAERES
ncbi:MAG: GNAT family N-acetyltransferase [Nitrospirota bacterium]